MEITSAQFRRALFLFMALAFWTYAGARPAESEAIDYGKTLYAERLIVCDGKTYAPLPRNHQPQVIAELSKPRFSVPQGNEAKDADNLNNIDFIASVDLNFDGSRTYDSKKKSWGQRHAQNSGEDNLKLFRYIINVVHENGKWHHKIPEQRLKKLLADYYDQSTPITCEQVPK